MTALPTSDPRRYSVYLQRDDYNPREYILRVLMMVCEMSASDATSIMMEANRDRWRNRALCGTWEEHLARHIHFCLKEKGLSVVIRPEEWQPRMVPESECASTEKDADLCIVDYYLDGTPIERDEDLPRYYQ